MRLTLRPPVLGAFDPEAFVAVDKEGKVETAGRWGAPSMKNMFGGFGLRARRPGGRPRPCVVWAGGCSTRAGKGARVQDYTNCRSWRAAPRCARDLRLARFAGGHVRPGHEQSQIEFGLRFLRDVT